MKDRLREFFAVTATSVYRVNERRDANGCPLVEKIARRDGSSVPVGGRLKNGELVAVTRRGLIVYSDDLPKRGRDGNRPAKPEEVNTMFWGGHTSPLVALFLKEEDARKCLVWGSALEIDPLWWTFTRETLEAIGDDHPTFILSSHPSFAISFR